MGSDLVDLLEKHTSISDTKTPVTAPKAKSRRGGFRPCPRGCGRFVRARNEEHCTQCRITFAPEPTVALSDDPEMLEPGHVEVDVAICRSVGGDGLAASYLRDLLRRYSAVQPFPEHVLLSDEFVILAP